MFLGLGPAIVPGAPGGPELLILFFMLFLVGLPLLVIAGAIWLFTRASGGSDEEARRRIAELEAEVERLNRELEAEREE